jgi:hypothetical protein
MLEKEISGYQAREKAEQDKYRKLKQRLDMEKDELQKKLVMLQHRDTQYKVILLLYMHLNHIF